MLKDEVRANAFDMKVGKYQAELAVKWGVGKSVLDIGCGIGMFTPLFLKKFKRVVGLDPSEKYLKMARRNKKIEYVVGYGETFKLDESFDTISMNMLLEHVDSPVKVLKNCKKHLNKGGRIIAQVPNAESITRRLGVLMGVIPSLDYTSKKERDLYGHQRTYTLKTLVRDAQKAGLTVKESGGILYKPLPNEMLLLLSKKYGEAWTTKLIKTLIKFGETRPEECAAIYIICE